VEPEGRHDEAMLSAVLLGKDSDRVENFLEAVAQVVNDDDIVTVLEKLQCGVRSDVAEATKYHDIVLAIISWKNVVRQVLVEGVIE